MTYETFELIGQIIGMAILFSALGWWAYKMNRIDGIFLTEKAPEEKPANLCYNFIV